MAACSDVAKANAGVRGYIIQADARLIPLADGSVNCVVTSPPYWGLRDYGVTGQIGLERTLEQYVAELVGVFREVRRVLRNEGTLWVNMGDGYTSGNRSKWRSVGCHASNL